MVRAGLWLGCEVAWLGAGLGCSDPLHGPQVITGQGGATGGVAIPPAPGDLVVPGAADVRLATAVDGRALVGIRAPDGALAVASWGPGPQSAGGAEVWTLPIELAPSAGVGDAVLAGIYAAVISEIQDLQLGEAGEAWLLYSRLQGAVRTGSRISVHLRHRHRAVAGAGDDPWDAEELVTEVGTGVVADPTPPRVRMARAPGGALIAAWSQRGDAVGARMRAANGSWGAVETIDPLAVSGWDLVEVAMDRAEVATVAWTRGGSLQIADRTAVGWNVTHSIPTGVGRVAGSAAGDVMWLVAQAASRIAAFRYSRASGVQSDELELDTSAALWTLAADASGFASQLFSPGPPPLDGPVGGLSVLSYQPGTGWSAPRELAPSSTIIGGAGLDWNDAGAGAIVWVEHQGTGRNLLRSARPDGSVPTTGADLPDFVTVSGVSGRARLPLIALWSQFTRSAGYDVVVRWMR